MENRMTFENRGWLRWLAANFIGIGLFLYFAIQTWIEPELADMSGANGGSFIVWGITALPIFVLFMLAHIIAGFRAIKQFTTKRDWRGAMFTAATLLLWTGAILFDNAHHGI